MKVLIDLQGCQSTGSRTRGIGRYSLAFTEALLRNGGGHEFWLLLNGAFRESAEDLAARFAGAVGPGRIRTFHPPADCAEIASPGLWRTRAAELVRRHAIQAIAPDIVHLTSLFEGLVDDCATTVDPEPGGARVSVTLYDLIPLLYQERYLADPRTRAWYMRKLESLQRADLLLGISQSACDEAAPVLQPGPRITNVSTASDPGLFHPDGPRGAGPGLGLVLPFVMYTGGIDWRKNIDALVEAWAALPPSLRQRHQLALVCRAEDYARTHILALARSLGLGDGEVVLTGYVPDETLAELYRACTLFVFPSLHEGFGLPALEAMMCGAPVIGAAASSIPEVIGRPEAQFDPKSVPAMTAMLQRGLTDDGFRAMLLANSRERATAFSWDATARRALEAMESLAAEKSSTSAQAGAATAGSTPPRLDARPPLAVVAPLPPAQSGIAEYTLGLLDALRPHYRITLVADQDTVGLPPSLADLPVHDSAWLREHAGEFPRVLYQIGNSVLHRHMFPLLRAVPGVVVMHDFFLSGVLNWMEVMGMQPGAFTQELLGSHGPEALAFEHAQGRDATVMAYPCNRFVLDRATGVIVQSKFSLAAGDRWYGPGFARNWRFIPLLHELANPDRGAARAALGLQDDDFLVCSFGHLGPTKLNHRLLKAWQGSRMAKDRRCRLVFVGENHRPPYGDEVRRGVDALPAGTATITGYADRAAYEQYLAACDVAVQLRGSSRGETSGAILDCLAWGVPLVANAHGTTLEYPEGLMAQVADEFSDEALTQALERLHADAGERNRLARAGRAWVTERHSPATVAQQYVDAIETFVRAPARLPYWSLVNAVADLGPADPEALIDTAVAIRATLDDLESPRA